LRHQLINTLTLALTRATMMGGLQFRSVTDTLLLLIISFAGDKAGGFRKPNKVVEQSSSSDVAALAEGILVGNSTNGPERCRGGIRKKYSCGILCCNGACGRCGGSGCSKRPGGVQCCTSNDGCIKQDICRTAGQHGYCLITPDCPARQFALRINGKEGLHCRSFRVQGHWVQMDSISRDTTYRTMLGFIGRTTSFDYDSAYSAMQRSASAGFSFGGFGASATVSSQSGQSSVRATSTDFTSSATFESSRHYRNEDGRFLYAWEWVMVFDSSDAPDITIQTMPIVQSDVTPRCFPSMNSNGDYTSCRASGCVPGKEVEGGCFKAGDSMKDYIGCYADTFYKRTLDTVMGKRFQGFLSCGKSCKKYKFFGLQKGGVCWCGNGTKLGPKLDDKECNLPCEAYPNDMCGARVDSRNFRHSLYINRAA